MPNKEFGIAQRRESWYYFLKTETQKQLKEQETEGKTNPKMQPRKDDGKHKEVEKGTQQIK